MTKGAGAIMTDLDDESDCSVKGIVYVDGARPPKARGWQTSLRRTRVT